MTKPISLSTPLHEVHCIFHANHICSDMTILPDDFFVQSPFGKSIAVPLTNDEPTIQSRLRIDRLRQLGFPPTYCGSLETGVPLLVHTWPPHINLPNYPSLFAHQEFAKQTLEKWHDEGFTQEVTEQPHLINPLGVAEKHGKLRLVVDATASGLNEHLFTPKFSLPNHSDIVRKLQRNEFLAKADFKNGFLQLPLRQKECTLLGFFNPFTAKYYVFTRLPFGVGSGTFLFQTFSSVLRHFFRVAFNIDLDVYIDDWLMHNPSAVTTKTIMKFFVQICDYLGITTHPGKLEGPAQQIVFTGLEIDTVRLRLSIPDQKRMKYLQSLEKMLYSTSATMSDLTCLAGKLVHVSAVHTAGASHTQPLWDVLYENKTSWTRRQLASTRFSIQPQLRIDLLWWQSRLEHPIYRRIWTRYTNSLFLWDKRTAETNPHGAVTITTDASSTGWGASMGTYTAKGTWSPHQASLSNNWRETKAITKALEEWNFVHDVPILLLTDNSTTVAIVNKRNPDAPPLRVLSDELTKLEDTHGLHLVALHLPGKLNQLSDALSRQHSIVATPLLPLDLNRIDPPLNPISVTIGLASSPSAIPRFTPMPLPQPDFLMACSTPDIPFVNTHLLRWMKQAKRSQGWIVIPATTSTYLPLPATQFVTTLPPLLPECPDIPWILLRWNSHPTTLGRNVKDVTEFSPQ